MTTNKPGTVSQRPLYGCTNCFEDYTWPAGDLRVYDGECWCGECWDERRWDFPGQPSWNDLEPYTPALQAENEALELNEQLDALEQERDHWKSQAEGEAVVCGSYRDERDALAAHVERLEGLWNAFCVCHEDEHGAYGARLNVAFGDTPETSLARLKARWQAEILNEFTHGSYIMPASLNLAMCRRAKELRRQAEGGDSHDNQ